jgi:hypothetical protein
VAKLLFFSNQSHKQDIVSQFRGLYPLVQSSAQIKDNCGQYLYLYILINHTNNAIFIYLFNVKYFLISNMALGSMSWRTTSWISGLCTHRQCRRLWRLLLSVPRLSLRFLRPDPEGPRAAQPRGPRPRVHGRRHPRRGLIRAQKNWKTWSCLCEEYVKCKK